MFRSLLLSLSVGQQSVLVSATVTAVSEPSVSSMVLVMAITVLQLRRHFWLRAKPEKLVSVGLYCSLHSVFVASRAFVRLLCRIGLQLLITTTDAASLCH